MTRVYSHVHTHCRAWNPGRSRRPRHVIVRKSSSRACVLRQGIYMKLPYMPSSSESP